MREENMSYEFKNMDEAKGFALRSMHDRHGDEYKKSERTSFVLSLAFEVLTCLSLAGAMIFSNREGYWRGVNTLTGDKWEDAVRSDVKEMGDTIKYDD